MPLSSADIDELRLAKELLENPGLAVKLSNVLGIPLEKGFDMLPKSWSVLVNDASRKAIASALDVAIRTLEHDRMRAPSNWWHKLAVGTAGAAGGALGLPALMLELPVSTTIMLRSIADIARGEGEDLSSPAARVECVQVLALGGKSRSDDAAETGYFAARATLAKAVTEAARHLAGKGATQQGAPALVRLISQMAARFSISVSQKAAAQAVPLLGAMGGAVLNTLFIDHFQDTARGHFTVRRLERAHGQDEVQRIYRQL